jgi:predicted esterase
VYLDREAKLVYADNKLGYWWGKKTWALPRTNGMPRSLMTMADNKIAWQTDNHLWQMDLAGDEAKVVYARPGFGFDAVSYFKGTEAFLVSESTNRATMSGLFTLTNSADGWVRSELARMPTIRDVEWINNGKGYACHVRQGELNYLAVRAESGGAEVSFFKKGGVVNVCPADGRGKVFAVATLSNEPPSVWQCDGKNLVQAFSPWGEGSAPACQPTLVGYAPYDKHNARFDLVPPANFSRTQKYPLVIGLGSCVWAPVPHAVCVQTLADSGAYVALTGFVFREDSRTAALQHTNQINAIYNLLAANPNVDTNRVFIFAFSASTAAVSELVKQYPGRFRGIILLHPGELPKAVEGMTERVLITDGSENRGVTNRLEKYREELCKAGIQARWFIHEGGGHIARAQDIMRERAELMTEMVFEK